MKTKTSRTLSEIPGFVRLTRTELDAINFNSDSPTTKVKQKIDRDTGYILLVEGGYIAIHCNNNAIEAPCHSMRRNGKNFDEPSFKNQLFAAHGIKETDCKTISYKCVTMNHTAFHGYKVELKTAIPAFQDHKKIHVNNLRSSEGKLRIPGGQRKPIHEGFKQIATLLC